MMRGVSATADRERRRTLGAWPTPPWLVDRVLDTLLAGLAPPRRVLDPSCGDGRFLAAAAARWPDAELHGVDVDAVALAAARAALGPRAVLHHGDGLADAFPLAGPFDVVVGNPPYLNQLATRTSRGGRSGVGGGVYADAAALFLARSVELAAADGGRVALVLPQSVLATRDAAGIRAAVAATAAVDAVWIDDEGVFDASVHTLVLSCVRGRAQGPVRRWSGRDFTPQPPAPTLPAAASWSPLVADVLAGVPPLPALDGPRLGARATATADFRDQYYGLVGHVVDDATDASVGPPLVSSGLIDPGACAWGRRPLRFAGRRYTAPRVRVGELTAPLRAWAARRLVPKVLVATQTSVVEACADERGELLPAVPVISVVPHDPADVWPLTAALCSPVAGAWAAQLTLGAGLSTTAVRLRAAQVVDLPLPARPWDGATAALRAGDLARFAAASGAAYGLGVSDADALAAWWLPRAERALGYGRPHGR